MPKVVDSEERRDQFVSASLKVIAGEGFSAFTMRRVADVAGCTTGSLTHYFEDKDTLLVATLRSAHASASSRMANAVNAAASDFERLRAVLLESLPLDDNRLLEWRVWLAFWSASSGNSFLTHENSQRYTEWRSLVEQLLSPLSKCAQADAGVLVALVDGLGLGLTQHSGDAAALSAERSKCQHTLDGYLQSQFGTNR